MNKKELCNICQKKEIECGGEGVYLRFFQGDNAIAIHICYDCYDTREQWYLDNYEFIYSYSAKQYERKKTGYVKTDNAPCYVGKKSSDGEILKQQYCPHCSPWKFKQNINSDTDNKANSKQNNIGDKLTNHWFLILSIIGIVSALVLVILQLRSNKKSKRHISK